MSNETKENIFMITAGFLLTVITIALLWAVIYAALNPPHACVKHNGEWVKSIISYETNAVYNPATKTYNHHKTGRIIYQFNGVRIVSSGDYFLINPEDTKTCSEILGGTK